MEPQTSRHEATNLTGPYGTNGSQKPSTRQSDTAVPAIKTTHYGDHTAKAQAEVGPTLLDRVSNTSTTLQEILDKSVYAIASRVTGGPSPSALAGACADWAVYLATARRKRAQLIEKAASRTLRLANFTGQFAARQLLDVFSPSNYLLTNPKVVILSAVETVYLKIASTIDAVTLFKMAEREQMTSGVLDGPLAFDNAISKSAAATKGIVSEVASDAEILITPDLEAGNMIAKQLICLAGAESAGFVLSARVPVFLISRADGTLSRPTSCVLAQLYIYHRGGSGK